MTTHDVAVVGGGLSGLTAAFRLRERGSDVVLLDAGETPGGNLRTRRREDANGDWLLDLGPNSFGDGSAELMALVRDAGAADGLLPATGDAGRRWLYVRDRLREVPASPPKFLLSSLLPLSGRLRLMREPFIRPRPADAPEESLAEFCDRRLGEQARRTLLTPVVSGIYAGDPEQLGAESAFPRMVALEREHGSLIRAARAGSGPPKRGHLHSFVDGLAALPAAITAQLGDVVESSRPVAGLARTEDGWTLATARGPLTARHVILATPAWVTAGLLAQIAPAAAQELAAVDYAPMAVAHVGASAEDLGAFPAGFGFLVPRDEGLRVLGCIASSRLFAGRAPEGFDLLTVFTGGRLDPSALEESDAAIAEYVLTDLRRATGGSFARAWVEVTRWPRAIPQYQVGHGARLRRIAAATDGIAGLTLLGNWKGGIAMPDCVRQGGETALQVAPVPGV